MIPVRLSAAGNKYHAKPVVVDGVRFDSKKEAQRWQELVLMERAGEIRKLERQPQWKLCHRPLIRYSADFAYEVWDAELGCYRHVYEDVKGYLLRDTRTKLAWLKEKYGIDVQLIK